MKNITTPLHVEIKRVQKEGPRKPLRTFIEMAEEFGVPPAALRQLLWRKSGPKPELKHVGNFVHSNVWYEPVAMRKWWKTVDRAA